MGEKGKAFLFFFFLKSFEWNQSFVSFSITGGSIWDLWRTLGEDVHYMFGRANGQVGSFDIGLILSWLSAREHFLLVFHFLLDTFAFVGRTLNDHVDWVAISIEWTRQVLFYFDTSHHFQQLPIVAISTLTQNDNSDRIRATKILRLRTGKIQMSNPILWLLPLAWV